jgi:hypothetical protein
MAMDHVKYHKTFRLADDNTLVEEIPTSIPAAGSIAALASSLRERQQALNTRLAALDFRTGFRDSPPDQAGIYPLKVTRFTCSCEGHDEDGMAEQLTARLGNLRIITQVPFMRKGEMIFAIRSQGLVDSATGIAESVDALFGGGIFWTGKLDQNRYDYELLMFGGQKDQFVGRMTESIDLTRKLGDIDPGLYQAEVAYHFENESNDDSGKPTLSRVVSDYGSQHEIEAVRQCYGASARFGASPISGNEWRDLAENARVACRLVPGKRYYQAYDAYMRGIRYNPM